MKDASEAIKIAEGLIEKNECKDALQILIKGFNADVDNRKLYELAIECLSVLGAEDEVLLFQNALNGFESFDAFNSLGANYFDVNRFDLALPFLKKASCLAPENPYTAHDLAVVFARQFKINEALDVLVNADPGKDFWNFYFWTKLRILNNDRQDIDVAIEKMLEFLDSDTREADVAIARMKVSELQDMFERLVSVEEPMMHIQHWHFIQYGGVVLDFLDKEDRYIAGGRYVVGFGTFNGIKGTCLKLKDYVRSLGFVAEELQYINDQNSKIIGMVLASILEIPASVYTPTEEAKRCLIVGANSSDFDIYANLQEIKPQQLVFAFNHNWMRSTYICPDVIGLMSQRYTFPWEQPQSDVLAKNIEQAIDVDSVVSQILASASTLTINKEQKNFYLERKKLLNGFGSKEGAIRHNFMVESPVKGIE